MNTVLYYLASLIAVVFVFCPHEYAHAYVAYKNGDPTAKMMGRMSLNPLRHFDPIGFILCASVGFGWAKPVPINPSNFRKYKTGLFTTAIAGVVVNYVIAFFAYAIYCLIARFLMPYSAPAFYAVYFLETVFFLIFAYSLYSFVFNLLPLFPLDGFRVVEAFTRQINPVQRFLRNYGPVILIVLVVESFACGVISEYLEGFYVGETFILIRWFDILGYVGIFARNIVGFPITAAWSWIFKI